MSYSPQQQRNRSHYRRPVQSFVRPAKPLPVAKTFQAPKSHQDCRRKLKLAIRTMASLSAMRCKAIVKLIDTSGEKGIIPLDTIMSFIERYTKLRPGDGVKIRALVKKVWFLMSWDSQHK